MCKGENNINCTSSSNIIVNDIFSEFHEKLVQHKYPLSVFPSFYHLKKNIFFHLRLKLHIYFFFHNLTFVILDMFHQEVILLYRIFKLIDIFFWSRVIEKILLLGDPVNSLPTEHKDLKYPQNASIFAHCSLTQTQIYLTIQKMDKLIWNPNTLCFE